MTNNDVILVTGATGKIGTALVHLLASATDQPQIRATTRDVNSAAAQLLQAMNPKTVELTPFNEDDPASLEKAFEGVTKLGIIAPFRPDMGAWHAKIMQAAKNCQYVFKVSVTGARSPDNDPPPGRIPLAHWQGEEAIRKSGIAFTSLRPTIFMQHFLTVAGPFKRGDRQVYLPTGTSKIAFVDCRDIAKVAAKLLLVNAAERQIYDNQAFELTGPAALTAAQITQLLSWVANRNLEHVDGEAAFVEHCQRIGASDMVKAIYAEAAGGWFSKLETQTYEQITGQLPTSFAKFAFDHAAYFQN